MSPWWGPVSQKDPGLTWTLAQHVNTEISMASQIRWGFSRGGGSEFIDSSVYKPLRFWMLRRYIVEQYF